MDTIREWRGIFAKRARARSYDLYGQQNDEPDVVMVVLPERKVSVSSKLRSRRSAVERHMEEWLRDGFNARSTE